MPITMRLMGGLGNQLFQWALGLAFESRGRNVKYDISTLDCGGRRYMLGNLGWNLNTVRENAPITAQEKSLRFDPEILMLTEGVLNGYWQSEKYFIEHENYIRGMIFRRMQFSPKTLAVAQKIKELGEHSCFVHVRRTDNLSKRAAPVHTLLTADSCRYYADALSEAKQRIPDVHWFIFSDDPKWVHQNWGHCDHTTVVDHNPLSGTVGEDHEVGHGPAGREVEDLWLMSLCRHAIIANSTFSWWSAWLNFRQEGRTVIAPQQWFVDPSLDATEICPERWTKL